MEQKLKFEKKVVHIESARRQIMHIGLLKKLVRAYWGAKFY